MKLPVHIFVAYCFTILYYPQFKKSSLTLIILLTLRSAETFLCWIIMPECSDLPVELSDSVIDHLWDDSGSLAACTLVCRAWLPSARTHLFSTVTLIPREWNEHAEELQALHRICPFIRTLKLHRVPEALDDRLMPSFLAMRRVNTLVLGFYRLRGYTFSISETFNDHLSQLPQAFVHSIKKLKVESVTMRPAEITELVSVFRYVSAFDISLSLQINGTCSSNNDAPPLGMTVTQMTYRRFGPTHANNLLAWLSRESGGRYPHTLRLLVHLMQIPEFAAEPDSLYDPMLGEIGTSLKHLWLTRNHDDDTARKF